MFELIKTDGRARTGKLKTSHGTIPTPFFMPVGTKAAVKHITSNDLEDLSTDAIICNAFVLFLRPGLDLLKSFGGVHSFMSRKGVIYPDS